MLATRCQGLLPWAGLALIAGQAFALDAREEGKLGEQARDAALHDGAAAAVKTAEEAKALGYRALEAARVRGARPSCPPGEVCPPPDAPRTDPHVALPGAHPEDGEPTPQAYLATNDPLAGPLETRNFAFAQRRKGTDLTVEEIWLSRGDTVRARALWGSPELARVLGLTAADVVVWTSGSEWFLAGTYPDNLHLTGDGRDEHNPFRADSAHPRGAATAGAAFASLNDPGRQSTHLTLEIVRNGAHIVRAYHWTAEANARGR